jgi:hypothetical protein
MEGINESNAGSRRHSCDRCGCHAEELVFDDISQKDLCSTCLNRLQSRRPSRL